MLPYPERMQREAARLRAALHWLEHENASHKAVDPDYVAVRRGCGRWITVCRRDLSKYHVLSRELRAVEAKLTPAHAQVSDFDPTDDELCELLAKLPAEDLVPLVVEAAASVDRQATEAARENDTDRAETCQRLRDALLADTVALTGTRASAPAAWPRPNQHGVYMREVCEVAASCACQATSKFAPRAPLAEVLVVEIAEGIWLEATDYQTHHGDCRGHGFLPNISDVEAGNAHPTRDAAVRAGAGRLLEAARDLLRQPPTRCSAGQAREARQLEDFVLALLSGVRDQLELPL